MADGGAVGAMDLFIIPLGGMDGCYGIRCRLTVATMVPMVMGAGTEMSHIVPVCG